MIDNPNHVLYIVRTWVPEEHLDEWLDWQTTEHVPSIVAQPQVLKGHIYRVADDTTPTEWLPQYVSVYEFATWEDWVSYRDGEAAAGFRADFAARWGSISKISRQVLVEEVNVHNV